jgi:hypothetical protein
MAQAHDLLTMRAWTGANLSDVVERALNAFTPAQVTMSGIDLVVSPKHALALSLALHELATNAIKYGSAVEPGRPCGGAVACAGGDAAAELGRKRRAASYAANSKRLRHAASRRHS